LLSAGPAEMASLAASIATLDEVIAAVERALAPSAAHAPVAAGAVGGRRERKRKQPAVAAAAALPDAVTQFHSCDLRVGKVITVAHHPGAEGLFHLTVAVGGGETRSVCAGLRKFLSDDDLAGRLVVLICNLKPRKLRGVDSEAMCLAGSTAGGDSGDKETVVPLAPPAGAVEGEAVCVAGMAGERSVVEGKVVNGKTWDKVAARLAVNGGLACYDGAPMIVGSAGQVRCALPDGAEIH
jgi:aminoacyl tRNA synthase complex-interacting multifunctional protein 1